jgi:hypothetical protein
MIPASQAHFLQLDSIASQAGGCASARREGFARETI